MVDPTVDARTALLFELFDDAGLFPPASLSMSDAVAGHQRARSGPYAWMQARFVCPASRLSELAQDRFPDGPVRVSAILDSPDPADSLEAVQAFGRSRTIETVEARVPPAEVARFAKALDAAGFHGSAFAEVPTGPAWEDGLEAIAASGTTVSLGAKIRCGGASPEATPSSRLVAAFIARCRDLRLRMKATAGLHHPFRHDTVDGSAQHGFINCAVVTTLSCAHSLDLHTIEQIVEEREGGAFTLSPAAVGWRDVVATAADVNAARRQLLAGIGSCSFDEPVTGLTALGVLPL